MPRIVRHIARYLLRPYGYSLLKQTDSIPDVLFSPLDHERDSSQYDNIWSHPGFITEYLTQGRLYFYDALCNYMQNQADIRSMASVVDVGCGPGYLLNLVAEMNPDAKLVGLDLSPEVLRVASAICPSATFRQHDAYEEIGETFDLAVCSEVLEHLDHPRKALNRVAASSRNIVITVPNGRKDNYPGHINFWSMRSWEVFLQPYTNLWEYESCFLCKEEKIATIMRRRT